MCSNIFQKFVDKILQKHLLSISSKLLLYIYKVPTKDSLILFSEHISRTAILTQALVITCK